jgi:hypothetical protein
MATNFRSRGGQLRQAKPVGAFARGGVLDTLGLSFGGGSTPVTPQQRTQMEDYLRSRNPDPGPPPVSPTLNGGTLAPEHRQQIMDYLRSRDAVVPPPAGAVTPPAPQMAPVVGAFAPAAVTGALTPGSVPASVFGGMTSANAQPADNRGVAQLTDEEQKTLVGGDAERKAKKERQNKYFGAAAKMMGIDWLPYAEGGAVPGGGLVAGPGDGRSDSVAGAAPGGPIRVSDGEYIIPSDVVSALGNGSTKAGAAHLAKLIQDTRASWGKQVGAFKRPRKG